MQIYCTSEQSNKNISILSVRYKHQVNHGTETGTVDFSIFQGGMP